MPRKRLTCKYYNECNAPICPLDPYKCQRIWYPDEEICRLRKFSKEIYIVQQKKIKKKCGDKNTIFTFKMLSYPYVVREGIKGIVPDKFSIRKERQWIMEHPPKR
ncbi:MAG: hypothetical protein J7K98_03345 [Candidatus Aenigmarchaeota archaeon]|nr:hypothetical protein [Candidatus Aenigmarchaeota archaeon]